MEKLLMFLPEIYQLMECEAKLVRPKFSSPQFQPILVLHLLPMKFFAFIMAFCVLALSVLPCVDAGAAIRDNKAKSEITKTTERQDHDDTDACSPFCQCSCCAGFSIYHFIAAIAVISQYKSNPTSSFLPADVIEVALPIWQPPQIV